MSSNGTDDPDEVEVRRACEERLARSRRTSWAGTAVVAALGAAFFTLFAAFRRPWIGLAVDAVILVPILLMIWVDHAVTAFRARRTLRGGREPSTHDGR